MKERTQQGLIQEVQSEAQSLGNEVTNKTSDRYDQTCQNGTDDLGESFKSNKQGKYDLLFTIYKKRGIQYQSKNQAANIQVNVKGKVSLYLTNAMKVYVGVEVQIHIFLTSALVGGERSASRPCRFTPQGKNPWYPLDRRLDGPQSRSGQCGEEKILDPTGTRTPNTVYFKKT
jgi:hypothetical protein